MIKLLEHWIKHNADHAASSQDWARKARDNGLPAAAELLVEVAEMTGSITGKFEDILQTLKK